ncbi:hypothetical protein GCM10009527_044520 [Actinomadura nitritigenes]
MRIPAVRGGHAKGAARTSRPAAPPPARGPAVLRQLKESPQAQEPDAFGLSIVKPCFSIVSTKSMVAPVR